MRRSRNYEKFGAESLRVSSFRAAAGLLTPCPRPYEKRAAPAGTLSQDMKLLTPRGRGRHLSHET